jgi:hypothetical protein
LDELSGSSDDSNIGIASSLRERLGERQVTQKYIEVSFRQEIGCEISTFNEDDYDDEYYLSRYRADFCRFRLGALRTFKHSYDLRKGASNQTNFRPELL